MITIELDADVYEVIIVAIAKAPSARTSRHCGIVSPSAFAVFMLITSLNCVGCWTARSDGLAPFRILST